MHTDNLQLNTMERFAERLGISVPTARALCREGKVPSVRIGRRLYVPESAFSKFVESEVMAHGK